MFSVQNTDQHALSIEAVQPSMHTSLSSLVTPKAACAG